MVREMNLVKLVEAVEIALDRCRLQLRACETAFVSSDYRRDPDRTNELEYQEEQFGYDLRRAHTTLALLLEAAKLPLLHQEYLTEFSRFRDKLGKLSHVIGDPEDMYSEALIYIDHFFEAVGPHLADKGDISLSGRALVERMLKETAYYLKGLGIIPTCEADVSRPMVELFKAVFPETTGEFHIPQPVKTYRIDLGIKSLKIGVEFKFADDPNEPKHNLDGIFTDMRGYNGTEDFKYFYAVFYTTAPLIAPSRIESAFKITKADFNWTPIVAPGEGGRVPRKRASRGGAKTSAGQQEQLSDEA